LLAILLIALIAIITLGALYGVERSEDHDAGKPAGPLPVVAFAPGDRLPVANSNLGAAAVVLGNIYPPSPPSPPSQSETKVVYNSNDGDICIRTKSGSSWRNNVQCVEGTKAKSNTGLTMMDWVAGPSIYFITRDNFLSGIDHIPKNDSWRISSVRDYKVRVHERSQIASSTRLNGTSAWVYYQDGDGQVREFGMDDFRDQLWHDGNIGPLGSAQIGSGIGVSRWINGTDEVVELFFQVSNGAIHGRMWHGSAWSADFYNIDGTTDKVPDGATITATTFNKGPDSMVLLAYIANDEFLSAQTRATKNVSEFNAFSSPDQIFKTDGTPRIGLAAIATSDMTSIYLVNGQKTKEFSSKNATGADWKSTDL
jgi:hypothetical protein